MINENPGGSFGRTIAVNLTSSSQYRVKHYLNFDKAGGGINEAYLPLSPKEFSQHRFHVIFGNGIKIIAGEGASIYIGASLSPVQSIESATLLSSVELISAKGDWFIVSWQGEWSPTPSS